MEMEKAALHVKVIERVTVRPCLPSPKTTLQLSTLDNLLSGHFFSALLVYSDLDLDRVSASASAHPAKLIREALSKLLVYYPPFVGRLRNKGNGELEVECTGESEGEGEGALFLEATAEDNLSVLGDLDHHNPSFQQLFGSPPFYAYPLDINLKDLHLLVVQVTSFICGGFVVGLSFHHGICDGRGAGQFVKGLAEMTRGEIKPSLKPIWNRELIKPEDPIHLQICVSDFPHPPIVENIVQTSLIINLETINCIKHYIMKECEDFFSTFEVVAALTWLAKIKAFQIPHSENVKLFFPMDMRRSFIPPLPKGYYGNAIGSACAMDNVQELLGGSLLRAIVTIKKSKVSLHENFRSRIAMKPVSFDVNIKHENVTAISDWRQLGFNEVDFGWGDAVNVSPVLEHVSNMQNNFFFLQPSNKKSDGIKILMFMPPSKVKLFKFEMEAMMNNYVLKM